MQVVRPIEEVKPFYNFLMGYKEGEPKEWYRGIEGVTFIWHGAWSDPELGYKGYAINEPTAVDGIYSMFREETGSDDDDGFNAWLQKNKDILFETLDYLSEEERSQ